MKTKTGIGYPYTELERLKWNIGAFLALLPKLPVEGCLKAEVWLWHSRDLRSRKWHHRATAQLQRWRKRGKVQIRATVALRVQQVKHQPDRTGNRLQSAIWAITFPWHWWSWEPAHTCTQPWQCPCPGTETGLHNYPGELFIPDSHFLFSKSHAF